MPRAAIYLMLVLSFGGTIVSLLASYTGIDLAGGMTSLGVVSGLSVMLFLDLSQNVIRKDIRYKKRVVTTSADLHSIVLKIEPNEEGEQQPRIQFFDDHPVRIARTLLEQDTSLALAAIRIDLERYLRELSESWDVPIPTHSSAGKMINNLTKRKLINNDLAKALKDIVRVCNSAVHGEFVSKEVAKEIIDFRNKIEPTLYHQLREAGSNSAV